MGYILFDSAPAFRSGRRLAAIFRSRRRRYGMGGAAGNGIVALLAAPELGGPQEKRDAAIRQKMEPATEVTSPQERNLKTELECGGRTLLAWKHSCGDVPRFATTDQPAR